MQIAIQKFNLHKPPQKKICAATIVWGMLVQKCEGFA